MDYLSTANRDILVTEDGSFTQRYVYDENSTRISAEYGYAAGTKRGEGGENLQSDFAANDVRKVWYRASHLGSTLFAVDENGKVISHTIYDPWGNPLTETYTDTNFSGIDNSNNYTGYTWDEVLDLYFAQNRFYDPADHRFTQEDPIKDGENWYAYCGNNPCIIIDVSGLDSYIFYDPVMFDDRDMKKYAEMMQKDVKKKFGGTVHVIATSTKDQFIRDWNSMGNNGKNKIDSVTLICHGNRSYMWIYAQANNLSKKENAYSDLFTNDLNKQTIGYFFILSCNIGNSQYDNSNDNLAMQIVRSKHIFEGGVVASDLYVWSNPNSTSQKSGNKKYDKNNNQIYDPDGDGFKLYKWNGSKKTVDITQIGHEFKTFAALIDAARKANPNKNTPTKSNTTNQSLKKGATGTITGTNVNLRKKAGTSADIIGMVQRNDSFTYNSSASANSMTWYKVKMTSGSLKGKTGYVASQFTAITKK